MLYILQVGFDVVQFLVLGVSFVLAVLRSQSPELEYTCGKIQSKEQNVANLLTRQ